MTGLNPLPLTRWPLERILFALAGSMTLVSAGLSALVSPWFLLVTALVGINQWLYVSLRACPASVVLTRTCRLRSALYPPLPDRGDALIGPEGARGHGRA